MLTQKPSTPQDLPPERDRTFIDVEVLSFGELYQEAVAHYISLSPERGNWPEEKKKQLVIRTECNWGRVDFGEELYLVTETGASERRGPDGQIWDSCPRGPLSKTNVAYVALFAEMPRGPGEPGFFEQTPFCKVPIDIDTARTLKSRGMVQLENFVLIKAKEFETVYTEIRTTLLAARERVRAKRAAKQKSNAMASSQKEAQGDQDSSQRARV